MSYWKILRPYRRLAVLAALMLLIGLLAAPATVREATAASATWDAAYWNNKTLTGTPVLQRQESEINYDWVDGAPDPAVNADQFSARWTRSVNFAAGSYRFTATTDDGMRVWVDGSLIIDSWWDSQVHSLSKDVYLNAGDHQLKVEYYEAGGKAVARLSWTPISTPGTVPISNWKGEYFNNTTLAGTPVLVRDDSSVDFDWGGGSPAWGVVGSDQFSVRWTRSLNLEGGTYRFQVTVDDGARLWVNGVQLVDEWHEAGLVTYTRDIELPAGGVPIRFDYFENLGGAVAKLAWTRLGSGGQWQGQYFANRTLSGSPALTRSDGAINFNWGSGAPAPGLPVDDFSVRWTRTMPFTGGIYRFSATSDDGVRVWVNNQLIIDSWSDHAALTVSKDVTLPAASLPLKVEYYEHGGGAQVQLSWSYLGGTPPPPPPPTTAPSGTVVSPLLNVRSGPGLQYNILSQLTRGQTVSLTGYRSADMGWVQINWSGATAWVSGLPAYLQTSVPVSSLAVWNAPPATTKTGTVVSPLLNVRGGPGLQYAILGQLTRGQTVALTGFRSADMGWVQIDWGSGTAWVSGLPAYLLTNVPVSTLTVWTAPPPPPTVSGTATVVNVYFLNVRSGPSTAYSIIRAVPAGTTVTLIGRNAATTWIKGRLADGTTGWMSAYYLRSTITFSTLPVVN